MIDILCFLTDLDGGGAQRTMVNLVNGLSTGNMNVELVVVRGGGPARDWLSDNVTLVDLECDHTRASIMALRRRLALRNPRMLFSTMLDANIVASMATVGLSQRPALIHRETNSHIARSDIGPLRRLGAKWAYRRADKIIALSDGVGRELTALYGLPEGKTQTIHNPVDISGILSAAHVARGQPAPWGEWASGGPVLLGVGRLTRQKGFDLLLRAVARLPGSSVRTVLLGDGPDRLLLERLGRELGLEDRLLMPGFVADPERWMVHADQFVLSSRWEGFGHVIVEAMACGLPVTATNCPFGPADIIEHGRTGILVAPDDADALANGISRLLNGVEAQALANTALDICRRFDVPQIAGAYETLFNRYLRREAS